MKTVIGNNAFVIKFAYPHRENPLEDQPKPGNRWPQRPTICYIRQGEVGTKELSNTLVQEVAISHPKDQFIKAVGRSISFKRAIHALFAKKELRELYNLDSNSFKQFMNDFKTQCSASFPIDLL